MNEISRSRTALIAVCLIVSQGNFIFAQERTVGASVRAEAAAAPSHPGTRFVSEKKIVIDPVTGIPLAFLTSTAAGDSKIYQTHPQWVSVRPASS